MLYHLRNEKNDPEGDSEIVRAATPITCPSIRVGSFYVSSSVLAEQNVLPDRCPAARFQEILVTEEPLFLLLFISLPSLSLYLSL